MRSSGCSSASAASRRAASAILYISHHLEEVYEICDRATVLRDGKQIVTAPGDRARPGAARHRDGRRRAGARDARTRRRRQTTSKARLGCACAGISVQTPLGSVEDVSLDVHAGECVGCSACAAPGAWRSPMRSPVSSRRRPARSSSTASCSARARSMPRCGAAVGYVPEDRHARGFVPTLGVAENLTLPILERLSRWGFVSGGRQRAAAAALAERLQIVASSGDQPVAELSGGNQQKVVVGRALAAQPSLLVVVSPTVGVDVASKEALLGVIDNAREDGYGGAARLRRSRRAPDLHARARRAARHDRERVPRGAVGPARADRRGRGTGGGGVTRRSDRAAGASSAVRRGARCSARCASSRSCRRSRCSSSSASSRARPSSRRRTSRTRRSSRPRSGSSSSPSR